MRMPELADDAPTSRRHIGRVRRAPCPLSHPPHPKKGPVISIPPATDLHARQHVGLRLRAMRETAGFTLDLAARHLNLPAEMLVQMESGQHAVPPPLAQSMTQMYGQPDSDVVIMARLARHRGKAADLAAWNLDQLAWESCATRICEVAVTHIPELFQTSAYTRAVFTPQTGWPVRGEAAEQSIRTGLAALTLRQDHLASPPLLPIHVVITESALRADVVAPTVMAEQLAHLKVVTAHCAVTMRILPRANSRLIGSQHGWRILEFSNTPEPRWLFRRYGHVTAPTEGHDEVGTAYRKFLRLRAAALSADDSQTFIQQLIHDATADGSSGSVDRVSVLDESDTGH